jgi:hypothetical protein
MCQRDDLVEHFGELLDVGQRLLVESIPHFLDCFGKPGISGFFSGHSGVHSGR